MRLIACGDLAVMSRREIRSCPSLACKFRYQVEHGRLACTVGADETDEFSLFKRQVEAGHGSARRKSA